MKMAGIVAASASACDVRAVSFSSRPYDMAAVPWVSFKTIKRIWVPSKRHTRAFLGAHHNELAERG